MGDWNAPLSVLNDWHRIGVNERDGDRILVEWNKNVSYYQEFSNAQVVAKSSVQSHICLTYTGCTQCATFF